MTERKNTYVFDGVVVEVGEEKTLGAKGFRRREFVVCDGATEYPQSVKFECVQNKCALLDAVRSGARVEVHFNLRGNNLNKTGTYYNNLAAWKIDVLEAGAVAVDTVAPDPGEDDQPEDALDLPF